MVSEHVSTGAGQTGTDRVTLNTRYDMEGRGIRARARANSGSLPQFPDMEPSAGRGSQAREEEAGMLNRPALCPHLLGNQKNMKAFSL
jgi:hypothetical protein